MATISFDKKITIDDKSAKKIVQEIKNANTLNSKIDIKSELEWSKNMLQKKFSR